MKRVAIPLPVLVNAGDLLYRCLAGTARLTVHGAERVKEASRSAPGLIFALWHGRLLLGARAHAGRGTAIMISRHSDGEIIARIVARHGYVPVRGSTSRGGGTALREMIGLAARGVREFALTPDGPRGPRHVVQPGVVQLASATGYAIVPSSASARPGRFLRSWDRFLLPGPFARTAVVYGEALLVPRVLDEVAVETACRELERRMIVVEAEADRRAGW
jgi:lysophospholipid acyltransferase (LPLAT)-like uncharacterized protein